ncbi:hypothetical protein MRX96_023188 [Rhipicephalus microplus]
MNGIDDSGCRSSHSQSERTGRRFRERRAPADDRHPTAFVSSVPTENATSRAPSRAHRNRDATKNDQHDATPFTVSLEAYSLPPASLRSPPADAQQTKQQVLRLSSTCLANWAPSRSFLPSGCGSNPIDGDEASQQHIPGALGALRRAERVRFVLRFDCVQKSISFGGVL